MEPIFLIVLLSIFLGVTATAQETLLEKKEKTRQEKLAVRQKFQEQNDKDIKMRIEAIEDKKRKRLLKIQKEQEDYEKRNANISK
jgi:hypothetical protein